MSGTNLRTLEEVQVEAREFIGLCQSAVVLMDVENPCVNAEEARELLDDIVRLRGEIWRETLTQRCRGDVSGNKMDKYVFDPMQEAYVLAIKAYKMLVEA